MNRFGVVLVLVVVVTALLPSSAAAGDRLLAASFQQCGSVPITSTWDIEAKRVGCPLAREVVRAYNAAIGGNNGFTHTVRGFHCRLSGTYGDGGLHRCTAKGHRVIKFARGG